MYKARFFRLWVNVALMILTSSCTYRFSNQYLSPPAGLKTIKIEKTYDTSGNAANHQILTKAFEQVIASDGKLDIDHSGKAHIYLRTNLSSLSRQQHKVGLKSTKEEPKLDKKPKIADFSNYKTPNRFANKEKSAIVVEVEFWNTRSRKLLFKKKYSASSDYLILDPNTSRENRFLRYEEVFTNKFSAMSMKIAKTALNDFYKSK